MAEVSAVLLVDWTEKLISSYSPKRHATLSSSPFLPRELKDEVFSHLIDDKRTLCLCANLNHEWAPSARAALFHTIVINNDTSNHDIFAFREWLGSGDISEVANHVRKLHFKGIRARRNVDMRPAFSAAIIKATDIAEALCQLPAVHSLQFERTALQSSEEASQCLPLRILKRLDMDCTFYDLSPPSSECSTHPTSGLVQILNLFSTIDVLRVSHVTPYRVSKATSVADAVAVATATSRQLSPALDVRRFISHGSLTESHRILFEMLASWPKLGTEMGSLGAMEVLDKASAFNSLVRSAGSHLTHLSLNLAEERIPEDPKKWYDLSKCKNLTHLTVETRVAFHVQDQFTALFANLASLPAYALTHFTAVFNHHFHPESVVEFLWDVDWSTIDDLFGRREAMKAVVVEFRHNEDRGPIRKLVESEVFGFGVEFVTKKLPKLQERGLLRFEQFAAATD
ncbi:hypothetical protein EIP91_003302 [Steccherinum ochraceum]|uniref:F-box domain-containing protein n=1 Tax=Steccherinum ochraceum TaxID=92696 RepID=A0A4R0RRJ0_9APHY|nr:hypothetical protein EIP91_003302 [Steccherinum ochraceum]